MALTKAGKSPGIYQNKLADGDIVYYYSYKDSLGKKHNVKVGNKSSGINATFAKNKRDERLNLLRNGVDPKSDKKKKEVIRFSEVWDFYINNKGMEEKTRDDRKGRWTKHMKKYFDSEVTVDKLRKFRVDKKDVLSPTSIDMLMAFTGTAINFWNTEQQVRKEEGKTYRAELANPMPILRAADKHTQTKKETVKKVNRERFLTIEEIATLKEAVADQPDLNLFVHMALSTGARLATVMSIKKISINDGVVKLINHKVGESKYNGFIEPKTQALLDQRLPKLKKNDTLFFLEQRQIQRRLQYIMNKLFNKELDSNDTVNRVMVHTLRHTFASHLVMKGVPLVKVKELMGHRDIETTMIYSHLAPDSGKSDVMELWS